MAVGLAGYGLAAVAGALSTLSPCVLPLVPILVGTAASVHRLGPYALALGLAVSFTVVGVSIASAGTLFGLSEGTIRLTGAVLLIVFGLLLLSSRLQERFAILASSVSNRGQNALATVSLDGLPGQLLLGLLLGLVWSPCVGPTLGATITLASQGEDLARSTLVMAFFGIGAGVPLVLLGLASRQFMTRLRGRLLAGGKLGKRILGGALLLIGIAVATGADKKIEAALLDLAPAWLVDLTTAI